jgi:hypothetical protein
MKLKTCKQCKTRFAPARPLQAVCSPICGLERAKKARLAEEKKQDRVKRESLKTIPQLIAEAQKEFNAYIRERDRLAGHPCISSGRPLDWSGNAVDAGHYRSTGAAPHLRFDEDNCHAQSKHDNQYLSGNAVDYRLNLIKRIGLERVERLENSNETVKWDRETLRQIKVIYRAKTRALRKERA